jgi:hypothetical protein
VLRHLGQPLERDPHLVHPRKGEADPDDSVFVVYVFPERDAPDITPHVGSIWLSLSEAKVAAERYVVEGHPAFESGNISAITIVEYETQKLKPMSQRHGSPLVPPRKPEPVNLNETDRERMQRLEIEMAELRIKMGIGTSTTMADPSSEKP